jgi:Fe-S-cluster-containing dehydrogenase component/DMSO reductase anchor subunit
MSTAALNLSPPDAGDALPIATVERAELSLIDRLLGEQQQLTAVEEFSRLHAASELPAQAKFYHSLLPAEPPGPGQQYAFDVDLDRCSGCKACVVACHTMNGLDDRETWRDVGLLMGGTRSLPVLQHVTTACHHCVEPGCLSACPVNAYEKDPLTGIVKHFDDQCFGCQYCTLACPYDVPKYHHGKGIVRKCDMCSSRLAVGEAPACVQACPHEAIRIQVVNVAQVIEDAEATNFLPTAPDPSITLPTTTYRTQRVFPRNMLPADYFDINPQHPHLPLVAMLVLTQLSVGAFVAGLALQWTLSPDKWQAMQQVHSLSALVVGLVALLASTLHLGRPQFAYRAILGIGHSWLSREIVAFGIFAGLAGIYAAVTFTVARSGGIFGQAFEILPLLVSLSGVVGVGCSVMIYVVTQREFWSLLQTGMKFFLTTALLGVAGVWLSILLLATLRHSAEIEPLFATAGPVCARLVILLASAKLLWEGLLFRHLLSRRMTTLKRSALLMTRDLSNVTLARFALGILGGIVMPAFLLSNASAEPRGIGCPFLVSVILLVAACTAGELLERYNFFAAVASPRMPGGIR